MSNVLFGTLVALVFLGSSIAIGWPLAARWAPREGVLLRGLAAGVVALVVLTVVFHVLLALSLFDRVVASVVLLVIALATRRCLPAAEAWRTNRAFWRFCARLRGKPLSFVLGLALVFVLLTVVRSLMLPTVGWDSITYHYVKAGMWVQSGGPITLEAPGGWSMYRSIFGGGEIFTAWAMLPFGNDLLAGAVDAIFWIANGLVLYALARELGIRVRHRAVLALYAMFLPAAWDAVGWGYVDLSNTALLLTGVLFATRYFRTGRTPLVWIALLALGLAAGIKLTSVPFLAGTGFVLALWMVAKGGEVRRPALATLMGGGLVAFVLVSPWLVSNFLDSGSPLRFPLTLFGIRLGADNPAFAWSQDRQLAAYTFAAEWRALKLLFQLPTVNESHLSMLSVLPLSLAPIGFARLFRARAELRAPLVLMALLGLSVLVAFYDRAFSFSRLEFTWVNGRFLMPIVFLSLPLAFTALPARGRLRDGLMFYLVLGFAVHFACFGPMRVMQPRPGVVLAGFAVGGVLLALAVLVVSRLGRPAHKAVAFSLLLLGACTALERLRELDTRYLLLVGRNVSDDVFRYWWQSAHLAEREGDALRIAVTAGPRQDADNWLMYYFMGKDLQNTLHYLPISTDGSIIPFGPDTRRQDEGDVEAWLGRIEVQEISHVFSFFPSSLELGWMQARPGRFLRLNGNDQHWALYRVLPVSSVDR